ncbi:MAG TPA: GreA/GreB family elongation factor [Chthoniobacterales bacterium]|jgi:transcription elongation GreA/GreB family factor
MSKAFTKEDVEPPERSGRVRTASGLPPGATNYITERGAQRLRQRLVALRRESNQAIKIAELESVLNSINIIESPPNQSRQDVEFGTRVIVQDTAGKVETYSILGVDELDLEPDAVSWISPTGKTLLAAKKGDRVSIDGREVSVTQVTDLIP